MGQCHCNSNESYANCCEPFITGVKKAPTAEKLMRSRYSSFVVGAMDYIRDTNHVSTRDELDMESVSAWALNSEWLGLEILETEAGLENDTEGKVEFRCQFKYDGKLQVHHELSTFQKEKGEWFFVDGVLRNNTFRRTEAKIGRNDPCPCGSGKKYKKCCSGQ